MIAAIILAAGESKRMGSPKMLLPWGNERVLAHVISVFAAANVEDILVITGSKRRTIEDLIAQQAVRFPVRPVFNPDYGKGEMLSSIQCGLRDLAEKDLGAVMIGLGDQPQVEERTVRKIQEAFRQTGHPLIVPSHDRRRGHPWLIGRAHWEEFLQMAPPRTPRDFLHDQAGKIQYVEVDNESIFADLDTPEDYQKAQPG
jgi:molybdenum cofactor cytidylyltransferase